MLPITRANLQNFCRVCLRDLTQLNEQDQNLCIKNAENYEKYLPNKICSNCHVKLNALRQFRCRGIIATGVIKTIVEEEQLKELSDTQSSETLSKLQEICRICLKFQRVEHSIAENKLLAGDIFECFGLNMGAVAKQDDIVDILTDNDGFPTKICDKCLTTIKSFKEFQMLSEQTVEYLKNIFEGFGNEVNDVTTEIKAEHLTVSATELQNPNSLCEYHAPFIAANEYANEADNETLAEISISEESMNSDNEYCPDSEQNCHTESSNLPTEDEAEKVLAIKSKQSASNSAKKSFKCTECNKIFYKAYMYEAHIKSVHENVDKPFACSHCPKAFRLVQVLHRHMSCCHENLSANKLAANKTPSKANHLCLLCHKLFKRSEHLKAHVRAVHERLKPFPCSVCGKTFGTKNTQMRHEKNHSAQKPYACEFCAKRYNAEAELRVHIQRHTANPALLCPICKRAKATTEELQQHIEMHKSSYQCTTCGKIFKKMFHLREHESTVHLQLRSLKCTFCDETFLIRKTLKNHEKSHDANGRPEKCLICELNFKSKRALTLHTKKIHEKES